jgi:hypothetical protein
MPLPVAIRTGVEGVEDGAGGAGGASGAVADGVAGKAQITKPPRVPKPSLNHVQVSAAAIRTPLGPLVPLYRVLPMVT